MSARDSHVNGATAKASRTDREGPAMTTTDNTTTEITVDQAVSQILDLLDGSYLDVDEPSIYYDNNNRSITHRIAVTHHRDDLRDVLDMDGYRIVEVDGTDVLYEQTDTPDPGHEPLRFWVYVSVPTVYVAETPEDTLWNASIGPRWTPAYQEAEDREDLDEIDRLQAEQDALAKAYGEAWLAAASRVAQKLGIKVDAIVTRDAAEIHSQLVMNGPLSDLPDLVYEVWQAAHDLLGVEVNDDGTWEITT